MKFTKILLFILFIVVSGLALFYVSIEPKDDLNWKDDMAVRPTVSFTDEVVSFSNLRNGTYSKEGLIQLEYYNQTFNVSDIVGLWMFVQPFGAWDKVAHTMVSFEFANGEFLVLSIEARQEKGEDYAALTGMFNQFETIYLWGPESDFVKRRMYWLEDPIRVYKVDATPYFMQSFFLQLVKKTHELETQPAFYNTWSSSCTSAFVDHIESVDPLILDMYEHEFNFPGVVDRLLHKKGYIGDNADSYDELKSLYTVYPKDVDMSSSDFSMSLRKALSEK